SLASGQSLKYIKDVEVRFDPGISLSTAQFQKQFKNRVYQLQLIDEIRTSFEQFMESNGYYFAKVNSIGTMDDRRSNQINILVEATAGEPLILGKISITNHDSLSSEQLKEVNEISDVYREKIYNAALTNQLYEKVLAYFENNGYPLARVQT
ncbi:MAG: hypothetical protein GWN62_06080, partial [Aliifodinibius sp.]|nr:hypothetical protein [candidate division KSB1 bacterium]NIV10857.1 hypothetical protein [Fodinibius sp.]NIW71743.1 hypothetical protein [candidate division KSB1 bacterium]